MSRRDAIVVFAKAPRPGRVKTRLCPPLSPVEAAELCAEMLADVLAVTARAAAALDLDAVLAVHPGSARAELARDAPTPFRVTRQRGATLAQRMAWALREAAAGGARRVLLRGSDSPTLDGAEIRGACEALEDCDVAVRPDGDGGYSLLALRRCTPAIFAHAMSTGSVLSDTLACTKNLGLRARVQSPGFDLDRFEDLARLARQRAGVARLCPRTLAYLDARELLRRAAGEPSRANE